MNTNRNLHLSKSALGHRKLKFIELCLGRNFKSQQCRYEIKRQNRFEREEKEASKAAQINYILFLLTDRFFDLFNSHFSHFVTG